MHGSRCQETLCGNERRSARGAEMDTEILVGSQFNDGRRLGGSARSSATALTSAWLSRSRQARRVCGTCISHLPPWTRRGREKRLEKVYASLSKTPDSAVSLPDIKLIDNESPIAQDVIAICDRYPARVPRRFRGKRIGNLSIVEAYIYPPPVRSETVQTAAKHGARVYLLEDGVAVVKQTVKRKVGQSERYVSDGRTATACRSRGRCGLGSCCPRCVGRASVTDTPGSAWQPGSQLRRGPRRAQPAAPGRSGASIFFEHPARDFLGTDRQEFAHVDGLVGPVLAQTLDDNPLAFAVEPPDLGDARNAA